MDANENKEKREKESFFGKLFAKLDNKLKEKADKGSCCNPNNDKGKGSCC